MQTLTVKVNNINALKLLEDLEALNLIQVIREPIAIKTGKKLSERLAGSITSDEAKKLNVELDLMRDEWSRNS